MLLFKQQAMQPVKTMMSMDELEAKKAELLIQSAQYLVQMERTTG